MNFITSLFFWLQDDNRRLKVRRNPVQRAASRLYRIQNEDLIKDCSNKTSADIKKCTGPEFVVRASLPSKQLIMSNVKNSSRKMVTVILLDGQRLDVLCDPNSTTAGQLFEVK